MAGATPLIEVEMAGLTAVQVKLNNLPKKVAFRILRNAVRKGAVIIRNAAKANLQAKTTKKTGNLLKSIVIKEKIAKRGEAVISRIITKRPEGSHAHLIEFGHVSAYKHGKYGDLKFVPARPFMRPAYEANRQKVIDEIAKVLGERIAQEAKGGAG